MRWRNTRFAAVFALTLVGLAVLPAVSASASIAVVAYWQLNGPGAQEEIYSCSPGTYTYSSDPLAEVTNPCSVRVWLHHYNSNGTIDAYCVNPGGVAYDFSRGYTELQVPAATTDSTAPCPAVQAVEICWSEENPICDDGTDPCSPVSVISYIYVAGQGQPLITRPLNYIMDAYNYTVFRVWLHQYDNGTGATYCISPGNTFCYDGTQKFWQAEVTLNQTPCNAGPPPY